MVLTEVNGVEASRLGPHRLIDEIAMSLRGCAQLAGERITDQITE